MDATPVAVGLLLVYPAILLLCNLSKWIQRKRFQLLKATGVLCAIVLFVAGFFYGFMANQASPPTRSEILWLLTPLLPFAILYPVVDLMTRKRKRFYHFVLTAFPALIALNFVWMPLFVIFAFCWMFKDIFPKLDKIDCEGV